MSFFTAERRAAIDAIILAASASDTSADFSSSDSEMGSSEHERGSSSFHDGESSIAHLQLSSSIAPSQQTHATGSVKSTSQQGGRQVAVTFDSATDEDDQSESAADDQSENAADDISSSSYCEEEDEEEESDELNSSSAQVDEQANQAHELSIKEEAGVRRFRLVVLLLLIVSGIAISIVTYVTLRNQEPIDYTRSFEVTALTISDAMNARAAAMDHGLAGLRDRITIQEFTSQDSFPHVTLPYFEVSGGNIRESSLLEIVSYAPLIQTEDAKDKWQAYASANRDWLEESLDVYDSKDRHVNFTSFVYRRDSYDYIWQSNALGPWLPIWQISPPVGTKEHINFDLLSVDSMDTVFQSMRTLNRPVLSPVMDTKTLRLESNSPTVVDPDTPLPQQPPQSVLMYPVYSTIQKEASDMVGVLLGVIPWDQYFVNMLPHGDPKTVLVTIPDMNGETHVYELQGETATRIQDLNENYAGYLSTTVSVFPAHDSGNATTGPTVSIYATSTFESTYYTWAPAVIASAVAIGFLLIVLSFFLYDRYVQRRNDELRGAAARTRALVTSLFPATVHDRLFNSSEPEAKPLKNGKKTSTKDSVKVFLEEQQDDGNDTAAPSSHDEDQKDDDEDIYFKSKPIADHFPNTTILFADLAGFTAWSSSREPHDVFVLLETVYRAFDVIAKRRGVFKVETVGDCYVAVTGLPKPRKDHAVVMVKFARDCLRKMNQLTKKLEVRLGPDVSDLFMRVGIHSGPVTGGVLRGEGSRFQLFGDSMNTASRIETSGEPNKIHLSPTTAELLKEAGKEKWLKARESKVTLKGKGEMQNYWLKSGKSHAHDHSRSRNSGSQRTQHRDESDSESESTDDDSYSSSFEESLNFEDDLIQTMVSEKTARLIEWNVEVLQRLLKQIVAQRTEEVVNVKSQYWKSVTKSESLLEEAREGITLPPYNTSSKVLRDDEIDAIQLQPEVVVQLKDFVTNIAIMYRDNPFHNFEHASHVCMNVNKYLSRVAARCKEAGENPVMLKSLHERTFRLTADPMTQFALVFASLILDVDHPGVPNSRVVKERKEMARAHGGKSVSESNSFLLGWDLLLDADYKELRHTICSTKEETRRFRQIVVNCVMATDVADKELQAGREEQWIRAFSKTRTTVGGADRDFMNPQVTAVIELLMQSADLSHTMQHYQVHCKWNERLFMEMFKAYRAGRLDQNPADCWYENQLNLFDQLVLPMAEKIKDCGIFGSMSDEMLDFASKNRYLWKENGKDLVKKMSEQAERMYPVKANPGEPRTMTTSSLGTNRQARLSVPMAPSNPFPPATVARTTLKIGDNDVTTESVTSALSLLMQKVQTMAQQEEALVVDPLANSAASVATAMPAAATATATTETVTTTIHEALKLIDPEDPISMGSSVHNKSTRTLGRY